MGRLPVESSSLRNIDFFMDFYFECFFDLDLESFLGLLSLFLKIFFSLMRMIF